MADVDRFSAARRNDLDAGRHLPERLSSRREGDEIAAVLHHEKGREGTLWEDVQISERQPADLHREVHDDQIDRRQNHKIDGHRSDASREACRLGVGIAGGV